MPTAWDSDDPRNRDEADAYERGPDIGDEPMGVPETERETLDLVMRQAESDLSSAHAEICKLQGLDPATHFWPDWTPQANTLRWFKTIRDRFGL
jgi:hypothetical protein